MTGLFCVFEWTTEPTGDRWRLIATVRKENDWTGEWLHPLSRLTHQLKAGTQCELELIVGRLTLLWEKKSDDVRLFDFRPPTQPEWLHKWAVYCLSSRYRCGDWWIAITDSFPLIDRVRRLAAKETDAV